MRYFGIALTLALSSMCWTTSPVAAQSYVCPSGPGPGEVQVGMTPGGNGVGAVPVCQRRSPAGEGNNSPQSSGPPDLSGFIGAYADYHRILLEEAKRQPGESEQDYAMRLRGSWDFNQPPSAKQGRQRCLATFIRPPSLVGKFQVHGIVNLIAPVSPTDPALLIFLSGDVPTPKKNKMVSVSLSQNGDPPQRISAYHFRVDKDKLLNGFVFVVPNTPALLGAIEDKYNAQISFNGKRVFSIDWYDGNKAKQFLQRCTGQAG